MIIGCLNVTNKRKSTGHNIYQQVFWLNRGLVCILADTGKVNLFPLFHILKTEDKEFAFLREKKLIPEYLPCKKCNTEL